MLEFFMILLLLLGNGIFAMAEIALISAAPSRLKALADQGNRGARKALALSQRPERLLSTVQIGITLVGVLAGAFGGSTLSAKLAPIIALVPGLTLETAQQVAFSLVVAGIAYLSLIIGELVPKGLALRQPELIACVMARPMDALARLAKPLVWFLELSTRAVMGLFGKAPSRQAGPTREEMHVLIREGAVTGVIQENESDMVTGLLDLRNLRAEEVMQPKPKVRFMHAGDALESARSVVLNCNQEVFPVIEGNRDQVLGTVSLRELYGSADPGAALGSIAQPVVFVPENQPALSLLDTLRKAPHSAAIVVDEFGTVRGMVTLRDLIEEIVGDLSKALPDATAAVIRETGPGTWLADAAMEIDEVTRAIPEIEALVEAEEDPFQTLGGYLMHRMDRLPSEGEIFAEGGFSFEILDMDRHLIDKVLIRQQPKEAGSEDEELPDN